MLLFVIWKAFQNSYYMNILPRNLQRKFRVQTKVKLKMIKKTKMLLMYAFVLEIYVNL